jgi:hypothetical protein
MNNNVEEHNPSNNKTSRHNSNWFFHHVNIGTTIKANYCELHIIQDAEAITTRIA